MRVRYGNPIKAISLLGQSNISFTYHNANVTFYPQTDGTFNYYANGNAKLKTINREANHKYFIYLKTNDFTYNWSYFGLWDTYNSGYDGNRVAPTKVGNGDYYAIISPVTSALTAVPTLQFGGTNSSADLISYYSCIIDLTSTFGSGKEPTAEEFYDKYHMWFSQLSSGSETVIDNKSGHITLKKLLPNDYQEVEYIESTGEQSIPLNYNATQDTEFELEYMLTGSTGDSNQWIMSGYNGGDYPQCTITRTNARFHDSSGNGTSVNISSANNIKHRAVYHGKKFYLDDVLMATVTGQSDFRTQNLTLFDASRGYTVRFPSICRIYSCKVWSNSTTIARNMIPCYKKSDGIIGMYDTISETFFTNIGSGIFNKGPNAGHMFNPHITRLPDEYQEVEYIESSNNTNSASHYIDTGITVKTSTKLDIILLPTSQGSDQRFFGAYDDGIFLGQLASKWRYGNSCTTNNVNIDYVNKTHIIAYESTWSFNNETKTDISAIGNCGHKMLLFAASYRSDAYYGGGDMKLYSCKIYDGNNLVRDFIPCYKKSDNVIGLYDLVSHNFFTNQGSGTFTKGPNKNFIL